ncbi:MAG: hypothetical protein JWN94_4518 [Betaproteobacteria bacterium]|nr:hypothetical protein [Betaproteobacteria bacterium]
MLEVDLSKPDKELVELITAKCKPFGAIKSVNLYRSPRPNAIVRMEGRAEAAKLAVKLGKPTFDGAVIIPLKQRRTSVNF